MDGIHKHWCVCLSVCMIQAFWDFAKDSDVFCDEHIYMYFKTAEDKHIAWKSPILPVGGNKVKSSTQMKLILERKLRKLYWDVCLCVTAAIGN